MTDKKDNQENQVPKDIKENPDKYADHLKSPMNELKNKGKVVNEATQENESSEDSKKK